MRLMLATKCQNNKLNAQDSGSVLKAYTKIWLVIQGLFCSVQV